MEFRTPVHIAPFGFRIGHSHKGLLVGSCFADRIGRIMRNHKLPVTVNPFGTLFNPASIAATLKRLEEHRSYDAGDLTRYEERWISFVHHGAFDGSDCKQTLRRINEALETGAEALRTADYAILTLGTAWVYELRDTGRIVANCHKLPAAMFRRRRMSASEIVETLGEAITRFLPGRKTILTVSPVRHLGDGATENTLSKSTLILAAHALTESLPDCRYFPAYEILMDDLRDYRFYERDMVHPSETAVEYIWEAFRRNVLDERDNGLLDRAEALRRAMEHRPFDPSGEAHRRFRNRQAEEARALQRQYPDLDFSEEIKFFES